MSLSDIGLTHSEHSILDTMMVETALSGYSYSERASWRSELTRYPADGPGRVTMRDRFSSGESLLIDFGGTGRAMLTLSAGHVFVKAQAGFPVHVESILKQLREVIPVAPIEGDTRPVAFWSDTSQGPRSTTRMLNVPSWSEVRDNYSDRVRDVLGGLVQFQPSVAGQLILWRGEPGTGKTWALRALIREWDWARFHYITDPDALFGTNPAYMLHVVLGDDDEETPDSGPPWKVLILEDSGEMLSKDARERTGQGLSRLLNLVDGLIGQGLRVLVLVTTNEELGALHAAIARPGRCAYNIAFGRLTETEARAWCDTHGRPAPDRGSGARTIAELYAGIDGHETQTVEVPTAVGFGR